MPLLPAELPVVHPGEILRDYFMKPLGMSQKELAEELKMFQSKVNEIVKGKRLFSAETALRLERYFGIPAEFWLDLQNRYKLSKMRVQRKTIEKEIIPLHVDL